MADCLVTHVSRSSTTHESITHLGNPDARWWWTKAQVIQSIESGTNTFYTNVAGKRADIGVVDGANGKYLRTYADGYYNNNLLELPTIA
jgi:hypothetical protein